MNKGPRPSRSRGGILQALSAVMLGASKCVFDWKGLLWFCTWCVVDIVTLACTLLYVYLHFLYTPFAALWLSNSFYKMSKVTYLCQVRWVKTKVDHLLAYDRPKGFSRPIKPPNTAGPKNNEGRGARGKPAKRGVSWSRFRFMDWGTNPDLSSPGTVTGASSHTDTVKGWNWQGPWLRLPASRVFCVVCPRSIIRNCQSETALVVLCRGLGAWRRGAAPKLPRAIGIVCQSCLVPSG